MPISISSRRGGQPNFRAQALTLAISAALGVIPASVLAATYTVTNTQNSGAGSLRQAMLDANSSGAPAGVVGAANTINFIAGGTIALTDALPMVFSNLTIVGNGIIVDGGNAHRCFFVSGLPTTANGNPQPIAVTLQNMQLNHCRARGGDGGSGQHSGGGGMGAGGAVFVNSNVALVLSKVTFAGNSSIGGNGGATGSNTYGAGGGLGGDGNEGGGGIGGNGGAGSFAGGGGIGGDGGTGITGGGGGGGFGGTGIGQIEAGQNFASAGNGDQGVFGGPDGGGGGGGGTGATSGTSGAQFGTGGVGGYRGTGGAGGFSVGLGGGGGGAFFDIHIGGNISGSSGGFGGGGGAGAYSGGDGGFGGGGGMASTSNAGVGQGGKGGFGGGGGAGYYAGSSPVFGGGAGASSYDPASAYSGFGGGHGGSKFGGGGAAMGGSVFAVGGAQVTIAGNTSMVGGQVTKGSPGGSDNIAQPGGAFASGIFLQGNGILDVQLDDETVYSLVDGVTDVQGAGGGAGSGSWGLTLSSGNLVLTSSATLTGPTTISGGTLELDNTAVSTVTVENGGTLSGVGSAPNLLNDGAVAPGNATTQVCLPPSDYQFSVSAFSQSSNGVLHINADPCGGSTQLVVSGTAGLGGTLYVHFSGSPVPGETFTLMTANALNGSFDNYQTNMPSVSGQIVYLPHSVQFTVIANDEIYRDGFEGSDVADAGSCRFDAISAQQFAAIPGLLLNGLPLCVPPFSTSIDGNTVVACQTSMCAPAVAGCPTTLHTSQPTLSGSVASGQYSVATPGTADTISAPVSISGLGGNVSCTVIASGTSFDLSTLYTAEADSFGGAYITSLIEAQFDSLNTSLSSAGCGAYGAFVPLLQPYVLPQIQTQLNNAINQLIPKPGGPGVGETICPAL